jgi:hypothetical protein
MKGEVMSKVRKMVLTVAALAALAVGGATFAQAQNSGSSTPATVKSSEAGMPGDPADAPSAEDQQGEAGTASDPADAPSAEDQQESDGQSDQPEVSDQGADD